MDEFNAINNTEGISPKAEAAAYTAPETPPDRDTQLVMYKRKIKSCYNWAGGMALIWVGMVIAIMVVLSMAVSFITSFRIGMNGEYEGRDSVEIAQYATNEVNRIMSSSSFLIVANLIVGVGAGLLAFIITYPVVKKKVGGDILAKSRIGIKDIVLGCIGGLGVQMISFIVQTIVITLTGYTGMNEATSSSFTFTDDMLLNVLLILYVVILGPILEECLYRGAALRLLSPVSKTFALVSTSLIFGLMHGNFNQIFNGILLGLILGYVALKSGSIKPTIAMHIVCNANAMIMSLIEDKFTDSEMLGTIEAVYIAVIMIIGIAAIVMLFKSQGKISEETDGYPYTPDMELTIDEKKSLTWKRFLKSPTFWIFAVYCIYTAMSVTAVA